MSRTADEAPIAVADERLRLRGVSLAVRWYRPAGARGGPTLVLLHEGLGSIRRWKSFPEALVAATGLPALAYDRQGHGWSDPLGPPGARARAAGPSAPRGLDYLHRHSWDELPAVLEASGVQDPVLVGHSDGGTIALLHASRYRARAVVTMAAHVLVEEAALAGIREMIERWQAGEIAERLARYHGDKTEAVFRAWAETWLAPWFRGWDITAELARVTCPCLLMQGREDQYTTPAHLPLIASRLGGPVEVRLVDGAQHSLHLEAPEQTLDEVARFLSGAVRERERRPGS